MKKYTIITCLLFSFLVQAQHYHVKKYNTEDGLINNEVYSLYQDKTGLLWVYNGRGISAFDGNKFKNFLGPQDLAPDNTAYENNGRLFYNCPEGLISHNYFGYNFTKVDSNILYTYYSDRGGTRKCPTFMDRDGYSIIYKYRTKELSVDTIYYLTENSKLQKIPISISSKEPFKIGFFTDNNKRVWFFLNYKTGNAKKFDLYYFEKGKLISLKKGLADEDTKSVFVSSKQEIYLFNNTKLIRITGNNPKTISINYDYKSGNPSVIAEDKKGNFWMGYYKGLIKINNDKVEYIENANRSIIKDQVIEYDEKGVPKYVDIYNDAGYVQFVRVDNEGNIVTGNEVYNGKKFTTIDFEGKNAILDILIDKENQIWYATFEGLFSAKSLAIDLLDLNGKIGFVSKNGQTIITTIRRSYGSFTFVLYTDLNKTDTIFIQEKNQNVDYRIIEASKSILLIANGEIYPIRNGKFEKLKLTIPNTKTKLNRYHDQKTSSDYDFKSWGCDKHGFVWGTTANFGYLYKTDGEQFWYYGKEDGFTDTVHGVYNEINHSVIDYVFTSGGIYNISGEKIVAVKNSTLNLTFSIITPIGTKDGDFYFAEVKYGTKKESFVYRIKNNVLERLKTNNTPPANLGFAFLWYEDLGKSFFSMNISQCYIKSEVNKNSDVIAVRPYLINPLYIPQLSSYHYRNGKLFAFSDAGYLQIFHIKDINNDSLPDPVLVTDFTNFYDLSYSDTLGYLYSSTQNKKSIRVNTKGNFENSFIPETHFLKIIYSKDKEPVSLTNFENKISLPYNFDPLTIYYKAVCLSDGAKLKYKYKLIGISESWTETNEDNLIYSTLPSGSYTLQIKACNNNGLWDEKPAELLFEVLPPWQRTWWAYTMYVFAGFAAIRGYLKNRTKKLEKEKEKLETTVKERTAEVVKQKHLLEEKNKEVIDSITYAKRIQQSLMPTEKYISRILGKKK